MGKIVYGKEILDMMNFTVLYALLDIMNFASCGCKDDM